MIQPAGAQPGGVPRLWAMCNTLVTYSTETGLHGGDFWVTVFHEYASRTGPVRDAVERTFGGWTQRLEKLIAAKGVATAETLHRYRDAWDHAADRTPHGSPIELKPEDFAP